MSKYREYLTGRIEELITQHATYLQTAKDAVEMDFRLHLSSCAANIWDTKCELEKALAEYDKLTEQPSQPYPPEYYDTHPNDHNGH